jgi:hypothetical protein
MSIPGFVSRSELAGAEWDRERKEWRRPPVDGKTLRELSKRSTFDGLIRVVYFMLLLAVTAVATFVVSRRSLLLAVPILYLYYFCYGFWVAIAHELQHKTVFAAGADWFSEIFFFFVQTIVWNSPTYAQVVTTRWLRRLLAGFILRMLFVGAIVTLVHDVKTQIERIAGKRNWMMREHCTDDEVRAIRIESLAILLVHLAVVAVAVVFRRWELLFFVTIAWQIGSAFEVVWHSTEHIGRPYDVNDHRLNTRSIRVSPFVRLMFWGLDDHVDHHLYPIVPSRNLPKLHAILAKDLPAPDHVVGCWREMFAIAREKERDPKREYAAVEI